jgi:hypothetical protein
MHMIHRSICFGALLALASMGVAAQTELPELSAEEPLSSILSNDGSIRLEPGRFGSFDPGGMMSRPCSGWLATIQLRCLRMGWPFWQLDDHDVHLRREGTGR